MVIRYNKLWKLLIDKGMTKTELRIKAGLTTNALARLGKNESVQVETLFKICNVLDCNLDDIAESVPTDWDKSVIMPTSHLIKHTFY